MEIESVEYNKVFLFVASAETFLLYVSSAWTIKKTIETSFYEMY